MSGPRPPAQSLLDKYRGRDFQPLYTTSVTVRGGQAGHGRASGIAISDDGELLVELRLPVELGGSGGGTNPEQLFAAGYAACFHGALAMLAERAGVALGEASVTASVAFGRDPVDGLFALRAEVNLHLPGVARPVAEELLRNTERLCPYVKMTQDGIESVLVLTQ
ncbi:Ohr family peroxiredoxin [Bordetella pseudohinzii]|uniref:General stress protein 17o n=1 Tax=Bordetella pseudohinzii TaxID=1331258 RepID=A0A0J6C3X2_9BORD|nr:Ohr family peroxiredoxin [Bordetella pseudohinzii]ANY17526.1 peroxiredoxin [Bordetella pseudohinzii]KMM25753.1 peroxiredoxin [Bordetella pseudohinzii]KXA81743.1 peroxiredoxin [Bordetella pseudohinzii]KXA83018.1 peroxiredoxin [Bordetella pseudohinzii]CUI73178.1 General stress protein 17o [Bordetella pseudohinzii]